MTAFFPFKLYRFTTTVGSILIVLVCHDGIEPSLQFLIVLIIATLQSTEDSTYSGHETWESYT